MRTTLDLDASVLQQLKDYQRSRGKSLGVLASELLAQALAETNPEHPLEWVSHPMSARVDLEDREAVDRLSGTEYRSGR
ncbi:MAG: hypothetical protein ACTMHH_05685 [Nesterenkonia sp.]